MHRVAISILLGMLIASFVWAAPSQFSINELVAGDGTVHAVLKRANVNNNEATPVAVSAAIQVIPPDHGTDGATETAGIYCKNNMDGTPADEFSNCIYLESDPDQSNAGGAMIKALHYGGGDGIYVGHLWNNTDDVESSVGFESAMFGGFQDYPTNTVPKSEQGFIATLQGNDPAFAQGYPDQSNSTGFEALVHDDSNDPFGETTWVTGFGLFYANNSIGNAFVSKVSDYQSAGYPEFAVKDSDLRIKWSVFNTGGMIVYSDEATAGAQNQNAYSTEWRGAYWDGAAEQTRSMKIAYQVSGAPTGTGTLRFDGGATGAEALLFQITDAGNMNVTGGVTQSGTTFRIGTTRTISAYNDPGNEGDFCFDSSYIYGYRSGRWYRMPWDGGTW